MGPNRLENALWNTQYNVITHSLTQSQMVKDERKKNKFTRKRYKKEEALSSKCTLQMLKFNPSISTRSRMKSQLPAPRTSETLAPTLQKSTQTTCSCTLHWTGYNGQTSIHPTHSTSTQRAGPCCVFWIQGARQETDVFPFNQGEIP